MTIRDLQPRVGQVWQVRQNVFAHPVGGYPDGQWPIFPNLLAGEKFLIERFYSTGQKRAIIVRGPGERLWLTVADIQTVAVPP